MELGSVHLLCIKVISPTAYEKHTDIDEDVSALQI